MGNNQTQRERTLLCISGSSKEFPHQKLIVIDKNQSSSISSHVIKRILFMKSFDAIIQVGIILWWTRRSLFQTSCPFGFKSESSYQLYLIISNLQSSYSEITHSCHRRAAAKNIPLIYHLGWLLFPSPFLQAPPHYSPEANCLSFLIWFLSTSFFCSHANPVFLFLWTE